jgi:hypothetical protein
MTVHIADELLDSEGRIRPDEWARRRDVGEAVGTCHCGSSAMAERDNEAWGRRFYSVHCLVHDHEAAIPVTRVVRTPTTWVGPVGSEDVLLETAREVEAARYGEREREAV